MAKTDKIIKYALVFLVLSVLVYATDFVPQGNIDMKNKYMILNLTNLTANFFCDHAGCYNMSVFNNTGSGDITAVQTSNGDLLGGGVSGGLDLSINSSRLNATISSLSLWATITGKPFATVESYYMPVIGSELLFNETRLNITIRSISLIDNITQASQITTLNADNVTQASLINLKLQNNSYVNFTVIRIGSSCIRNNGTGLLMEDTCMV
jgi:hypothetical protein